jgi:hypothetical protein
MGTGAPLELARHQLTEHHDSFNEENMAQLNPSILLRKRLRAQGLGLAKRPDMLSHTNNKLTIIT